MKFRIHFEIDNTEDYFDVEADTLDEIITQVKIEEEKRGLTLEKNNLWSEQIN